MNISEIIASIKLYFTPTTSAILESIAKLETRLEAAIEKDTRALSGLFDLREAVDAEIRKTNSDVDAAYKLLNNLTGLTK